MLGFTGRPPAPPLVILAQSAVAVPLTGTLAETVLATIAIPANAMGKNGQVEIEALTSQNGTANSKILRFKFGAMIVLQWDPGLATNVSSQGRRRVANRNATNSQVVVGATSTSEITPALVAATTGAIDTTAVVNITITGQLANIADNITLESYRVLLFPKS